MKRLFSKAWAAMPGFLRHPLVVVIIALALGSSAALAVLAAISKAVRRALRDAIDWLAASAAIPNWLWILGLIALLVLLAVLIRRVVVERRSRPAETSLAREFRDRFLELIRWELGMRYEFSEHISDPNDDEHDERYADRRAELVRLHDEIGPTLRKWLTQVAERRYQLHHDPPKFVVSGADPADVGPDEPYTVFFDGLSLGNAFDAARGWSHGEWQREIRRREDALNAFVRWYESGGGQA